jgi:hypothetical protein
MSHFVVIPHTVRFTRPGREPSPRTSYQVIDRDAGHNAMFFPNRVAATCRDEIIARQIADLLNGQYFTAAEVANRTREDRIKLEQAHNVAEDQAKIIRRQREEISALQAHLRPMGSATPESDHTLRMRIKINGVFNRDEQRLHTEQGIDLDKLAAEYGLLRGPAVEPVHVPVYEQVKSQILDAVRKVLESHGINAKL